MHKENKRIMNINPNEESSQSQRVRIQAYLESGHTLTQMQALKLFGCERLASRINDLRNRGLAIKTDMIVTFSGKRVAQYSLI